MCMYYIVSTKGIAMMLISLGIGYIVLVKADEKKGFLKQLGIWIGGAIIVISILSSLCKLYHCIGPKMPFKCLLPPTVCPMMPAK